ncbi:hypothetical protein NUW54_g6810 [Trametes sanguinea]|uniref:Uncharacterized protein n=1 Tax=Trametes sanguinea TaxID=158606 RepID=A0ACC1PRA1_9APHY|nr:hypothetical protein NUW54_g6810 [Trametes sanguinea]
MPSSVSTLTKSHRGGTRKTCEQSTAGVSLFDEIRSTRTLGQTAIYLDLRDLVRLRCHCTFCLPRAFYDLGGMEKCSYSCRAGVYAHLFFEPEYAGRSPNPDLFSLGLTSRSMSGPVLNVLRADLRDMIALMFTFPPDLLSLATLSECDCDRQLILVRAPKLENDLASASRPPLPNFKKVSVWESSPFYIDNYHLNLCRVCATQDRPRPCRVRLEPFLGPRVENTIFEASPDEDRLPIAIQNMSRFAPRTRSSGLFSSSSAPIHAPSVSILSNIVDFSLLNIYADLSAQTLRGSGTLPWLKKLKFGSIPQPEENWNWDHFHREPLFPSLERLELIVQSPAIGVEWSTGFVRTIISPSLANISITHRIDYTVNPRMTDALNLALCEALANLPSKEKISVLELTTPQRQERHIVQDGTVSHMITPLFQLILGRLQELRIGGEGFNLLVDDAMLDAMSRAWLHIRTLQLRSPHSRIPNSPDSDCDFVLSPVHGRGHRSLDW